MIYPGIITDVRDHPTRPLRVELDLGDGDVTEWMMCSVEAWSCITRAELKAAQGVQVLAGRWPYTGAKDDYRVIAVFPTGGLTLPDNEQRLARVGDPVGLRGTATLGALLPGSPLSINIDGEIK
jgi:hypothetical protein